MWRRTITGRKTKEHNSQSIYLNNSISSHSTRHLAPCPQRKSNTKCHRASRVTLHKVDKNTIGKKAKSSKTIKMTKRKDTKNTASARARALPLHSLKERGNTPRCIQRECRSENRKHSQHPAVYSTPPHSIKINKSAI